MSEIEVFQEEYPTLESYWRSVILFGRNVASYKFALAKSLIELSHSGMTEVTLVDLAKPFAANLCEHLRTAPKQVTSSSSQFLDACNQYNQNLISYDQLIDITVKKGFNNVIDAFHIVNDGAIPIEFYSKDYSAMNKSIILTDELYKLREIPFFHDLNHEVESRWNLVETAWELGISRNLLDVKYDDIGQLMYVEVDTHRRKDVTSARDALNGYQKGKCFYCFDDITVEAGHDCLGDVDHFFPHALQAQLSSVNFNGVWNLVLSCSKCNRGIDGKFAKAPAIKYLNRLHKRNEFLICSHHPLRETLMSQTGKTQEERINFLGKIDKEAINYLIHRWERHEVGPAVF